MTIPLALKICKVQMIPSALEMIEEIASKMTGRRVAFFLDYDGTLTPIIDQPKRAYMTEVMRKTVSTLAGLCPVAIVSGRDRADVENFVQLDSIFYAGSHGFDIVGPKGSKMRQQGKQSVSLLREAEERARLMLEGIQGAHVESKAFAFAIHYRLVPEAEHAQLEQAVAEVAAGHPGLKLRGGKKVYEFLPNLNWDKGKAVEWLLDALNLNDPGVLPFYLGDDLTDEDGFEVMLDRGVGIIVAEAQPEGMPPEAVPLKTKASYRLTNVEEVKIFLDRMAALLAGPSC